MRSPDPTSIPDSVIPAIVALLIGGVGLGALYGGGLISIIALDAIFFGALVLFVPWAVWKRDPKALAESKDSTDNGSSAPQRY